MNTIISEEAMQGPPVFQGSLRVRKKRRTFQHFDDDVHNALSPLTEGTNAKMSKYRMIDITKNLHFRVQSAGNDTFVAIMENRNIANDNIGALYYVVAVVLIYALSIVMMIASHIRKNKQDNQLRSYLKEMAILRKKNRREQVLEKITDLATKASNSTKLQVKETSLVEAKQRLDSAYSHHMPYHDDESREWLFSSKANSTSDNDDSVFHLPNEYCIDGSTPTGSTVKKVESPSLSLKQATPKLVTEGRSFFQVINENVPL